LSRKLLIGAAALVLLALAGIGTYAYQFFTPQKASSSSTAATLSTPTSSRAVGGTLAGKWVVSSGSSVGYRATEQFVGVILSGFQRSSQSIKVQALASTPIQRRLM
jgi:hypothetical protein